MTDIAVSVLIVSHGHGRLVKECLKSLPEAMRGLRYETIVIDNLAEPDFLEQIGGPSANVTLISNETRLGFGANTNKAARQAKGRILLILNPDTVWHAGRVADAVTYLEADKSRGIVSALLLNRDLSVQGNYRDFTSLAFVFLRGIGADNWAWKPRLYTQGKLEDLVLDCPQQVDWVYGSFMLIRRQTFEEAGGFDEGFFMYYEDVDLCYRLRKAGLSTTIFPDLVFVHDHQRTSSDKVFSRQRTVHLKSVLRYLRKTGAYFNKPPLSEFPSGEFDAEFSHQQLQAMRPDSSRTPAPSRFSKGLSVFLFVVVIVLATYLAGMATYRILGFTDGENGFAGPARGFVTTMFAISVLLAQFMLQEFDPVRLGDTPRRVVGVVESGLMAAFLVALLLVVFKPAYAAQVGATFLLFVFLALVFNGILVFLFTKTLHTQGARVGVIHDREPARIKGGDTPALPIGLQSAVQFFSAKGQGYESLVQHVSKAIREDRIDHILVFMEERNGDRILNLVRSFSMFDVPMWYVPSGRETTIGDIVALRMPMRSRAREGIKRGLDLSISLAALAVLLLPMLLIGLAVKLESKGPVFFGQPRLGRNQVPFLMLKFRTMYQGDADIEGNKLTTKNDPRITRIGAFLRKTSLDELPQLLNVIHGDMSIVGPRPLPPKFHFKGALFEEAIANWHHRTRVRPGITGLSQIKGLRGTPDTYEQALEMMKNRVLFDNLYIEHWSIWLDFRILVMTILSGAFMSGAY